MTMPEEDAPPWGSPGAEPPPQPVLGLEQPSSELVCPVCRGSSFRDEEGRLQTRWGMSSHVLTMKVCDRCSYVLLFHQGSGMAM